MRDLSTMGKAFNSQPLIKELLDANPIVQFETWLNEAIALPIPEANAMTLATSDADNQPNARIVLLKKFDETGFIFFGHYDSQKGQELAHNPKASLLFWWGPLNRQIRLQGTVSKLDKKSSANYYHSRPLESQIAAIISPQSKKILDKNNLIQDYEKLLAQHQQKQELPECPDYWGGFNFMPHRFEFWQGSAHRLHDRFIYDYDKNTQAWGITQLAP
jgi:pyridoxamine 5'-phosphate oxidase